MFGSPKRILMPSVNSVSEVCHTDINIKGDNESMLCSQLVSAATVWPKKKVIAGLNLNNINK